MSDEGLAEIKAKSEYTYGDIAWLVAEVERLRADRSSWATLAATAIAELRAAAGAASERPTT